MGRRLAEIQSADAAIIAIATRRSGRHRAGDQPEGCTRSGGTRRLPSGDRQRCAASCKACCSVRNSDRITRHSAHRRGELVRRCGERARLFAARGGDARLRQHHRDGGHRVAGLRARGDQGGAGRRGRCGGGGAAERDVDRARRHCVRRLPVVRGARDRHRSGRRLPDAVLRLDQDRARHAPSQRPRCAGAGHARRTSCARSWRRTARSSGSASWRPRSRWAVSIRMPAKAACSAARKSRSSARRLPTLRRKASK